MMNKKEPTPVHCDPAVLHAPGECEFCDKYGTDWQAYRQMAGINFTGHHDDGKALCPSEYRRSVQTINRWPGNRASKLDGTSQWQPGDPCGVCGSTNTWWDPADGGSCGACGATDADE
jgi:hypothetical protein